jgi:hypothetical protein
MSPHKIRETFRSSQREPGRASVINACIKGHYARTVGAEYEAEMDARCRIQVIARIFGGGPLWGTGKGPGGAVGCQTEISIGRIADSRRAEYFYLITSTGQGA